MFIPSYRPDLTRLPCITSTGRFAAKGLRYNRQFRSYLLIEHGEWRGPPKVQSSRFWTHLAAGTYMFETLAAILAFNTQYGVHLRNKSSAKSSLGALLAKIADNEDLLRDDFMMMAMMRLWQSAFSASASGADVYAHADLIKDSVQTATPMLAMEDAAPADDAVDGEVARRVPTQRARTLLRASYIDAAVTVTANAEETEALRGAVLQKGDGTRLNPKAKVELKEVTLKSERAERELRIRTELETKQLSERQLLRWRAFYDATKQMLEKHNVAEAKGGSDALLLQTICAGTSSHNFDCERVFKTVIRLCENQQLTRVEVPPSLFSYFPSFIPSFLPSSLPSFHVHLTRGSISQMSDPSLPFSFR
jgi:hypothetical protein